MDLERAIEFILEQNAAFAANLAASTHEASERMKQTELNIDRLIEAQYNTEQNVSALSHQLDALTKRQVRNEDEIRSTTEAVRELTENMNALIKVVDDLVHRKH